MIKLVVLFAVTCAVLIGHSGVEAVSKKYFAGYQSVHQPKLEKRQQQESELTTYLKEKSKVDRDTTRREHKGVWEDTVGYGGYGSSRKHAGKAVEKSTPTQERLGEIIHENKEALRYERKRNKQREMTEEIKHEPMYQAYDVSHSDKEGYGHDDKYGHEDYHTSGRGDGYGSGSDYHSRDY